MQSPKQQTGRTGEQIAAAHLERQGFTILETNWRCPYGEIDIVAARDNLTLLVEVRTRHTPTTELPLESIGTRKQEKMARAAAAYQDAHPSADETAHCRVDVIAVALVPGKPPLLEHVEDALGW